MERLSIVLREIRDNSYEELERELGRISGVTAPGLDVPTRRLELLYDPQRVSRDDILTVIRSLGYEWIEGD